MIRRINSKLIEDRAGGLSIGDILRSYASVPDGYLECDGSVYLQSAYPLLYESIGLIGSASYPLEIQTTPFNSDEAIKGIASNGSVYVAVGNKGNIATSTDGETWTLRTSIPPYALHDVIYANDVFVVVGSQRILYSADGITWVVGHSTDSANYYYKIAFGNGVFVAVGRSLSDTGRILTSTDGISWTGRSVPSNHYDLAGISFGNGLFLTCGLYDYRYSSTDGITWTSLGSGSVSYPHYNDVIYAFDKFFLSKDYSSGLLYTSTDGVSLTSEPSIGVVRSFFLKGDMLFAVGKTFLKYTTDGETWNTYITDIDGQNMWDMFADDDMYLVGGYNNRIGKSLNIIGDYDRVTSFQVPDIDTNHFIKAEN